MDIRFEMTMGGCDVVVKKVVAFHMAKDVVALHIDREGVFPATTIRDTFFRFSPENLRQIAEKAEAVKNGCTVRS